MCACACVRFGLHLTRSEHLLSMDWCRAGERLYWCVLINSRPLPFCPPALIIVKEAETQSLPQRYDQVRLDYMIPRRLGPMITFCGLTRNRDCTVRPLLRTHFHPSIDVCCYLHNSWPILNVQFKAVLSSAHSLKFFTAVYS